MAYIYQITNDINGKIYIGKTERTVEERWQEHQRNRDKESCKNRPLYRAMNKYGIEHFHIKTLEETNNPEERETYWIEQKQSFKYGYNATMGGDGKKYIDYDLVVATYQELQNINEVAGRLNISSDSVSKILKSYKVKVLNCGESAQKKVGKIVNQYDLQNNFISSFPSAKAAAEFLNKITTSSNGASSHISDVCRGKRKTAYGFIWKFADMPK